MIYDKKYIKSHPWLSFEVDMSRARPSLWIRLGEAQSKCEHITEVPLRPGTADKLYQIYLAKGVHATTAIEGNTLSERQVLEHIEKGRLDLPPSKEYLEKEIDNVIRICNELNKQLKEDEFGLITVEKIKDFNKKILEGLSLNEGVVPGEIRKHSVQVGRYIGAPAEDCEHLLGRLCEWLKSDVFEPREKGDRIVYGIIKSIVAHLYLAWIHPFGDGNGRTARIIEFYILISAGVPDASSQLLSNHYNETRTEYYRQLEKTSTSGGNVLPFIEYAVQGFVDGLRDQLWVIRDQQWDVAWENFVHDSFKGKKGNMVDRQKHLVFDLSAKDGPVPMNKIIELSPRMALAYANKTTKTISRDVNDLLEMKPPLIEKTKGGIEANKWIILAFRPKSRRVRSKGLVEAISELTKS